MARDQAKALERHTKAVDRHHRKVHRLRSRSVTLSAVSGAAAVLGVVSETTDGPSLLLFAGSAVSAVIAVRSRYESQHAKPPELSTSMPVSTARDLRREAIGWAEAQGFEAVRRQLLAMLPAVSAMHAEAGRELRTADDEAAPVFGSQITRLVLLDQVRRDLPRTGAALAADTAAQQVRARLGEGVSVYDHLLAAAATMLASPDLGRSAVEVLAPAADALMAYADGLRVAGGEH